MTSPRATCWPGRTANLLKCPYRVDSPNACDSTIRLPYSPAGAADAAVATASPARSELPSGAVTVEFRKSGLTAVWDDEAESLLAFAEEQGLSPDFSCRAGICSTCKSRILEGEVAYFEEPLDEPGAGEVLLCCSKPKGAVVLDI